MVTFYERLVAYYSYKKVTPLTSEQKPNLGRIISTAWYNSDDAKYEFVFKVESIEDTGTFKVLSYPDSFTQEIDRLIEEWYFPPIKRVRNRKAVKPQPEISVKPSKSE